MRLRWLVCIAIQLQIAAVADPVTRRGALALIGGGGGVSLFALNAGLSTRPSPQTETSQATHTFIFRGPDSSLLDKLPLEHLQASLTAAFAVPAAVVNQALLRSWSEQIQPQLQELAVRRQQWELSGPGWMQTQLAVGLLLGDGNEFLLKVPLRLNFEGIMLPNSLGGRAEVRVTNLDFEFSSGLFQAYYGGKGLSRYQAQRLQQRLELAMGPARRFCIHLF